MLYSAIAKQVLLPLYLWKDNNKLLQRLARLEASQYFAPREIEKLQFESLKKILIHSYQNVPFYRDRFDSVGFNPANFRDPRELESIPFLTKTELQNNLADLTARNYRKDQLFIDSSGGSTGKPTSFYKDTRRYYEGRADIFRHDRWSGWDLGEKFATLWGAQRDFEKQPSFKSHIIEKYIFRTYGFNAFDIDEQKVLLCIDEMMTIRPAMILAYANVAHLFAKVIFNNNVDMGPLKLKGLISSAETLTDAMRNDIEAAFKCKVLNRYGSREVGVIASECLTGEGLHINAESIYLELCHGNREAGAGESGEIVVTDLWNYGMPFIRYQTGDVAVRSDALCSCGRRLPMLKEVKGRVSDFIVDTKGGLVHGEYFSHLFYGLKGIEQFQMIQEDARFITLKIVPGKDYSPSVLEPVIDKIKLCLGSDISVSVETCTSSIVEASGKFRFTVSKIAGSYFNN